MNFTIATTLDEALAAVAAGARPVAGGSDLVVGARQGKSPLPESVVAIDRIDSLANIEGTPARCAASARWSPMPTLEVDATIVRRIHRSRRCQRTGRLTIDSQRRHDRRQRDERVPGDGHRRSADGPGCRGRAAIDVGHRAVSPSAICGRHRVARRRNRTNCASRSTCRPGPTSRAARTSASSIGGRWRSPSSARPLRSRSTRDGTLGVVVDRTHGRRPDHHRRRRNRCAGWPTSRRRRCSPRSPPWPASRPRRSATCGPAMRTGAIASV